MKDQSLFQLFDSEIAEGLTSRRAALRKAGTMGAVLAAGALPLAFRRAFGADGSGSMNTEQVVGVLNFALTLEFLEDEYYVQGLETPGLIPEDGRAVYEQISKHESAHVDLLIAAIESLGGQPVAKPEFDFTAGGTFNPFEDYHVYLALSQGFEDTGVRAYKGQAGNLMGSGSILTTALQIHSVEARHAAQVRRLRGFYNGQNDPPAWIEFGRTDVDALKPVYRGENNRLQLGIRVDQLENPEGVSPAPITQETATESYDEPLTMEEVLAIAGLFIA